MSTKQILILFLVAAMSQGVSNAASVSILPSKDNTMFENMPNNSGGGAAGIFSGNNNTPSKRRGLIAFNIAGSVPTGSTITGVELSMYLANAPNTNNQTIGLHRLSLDWGENRTDTSSPLIAGAGNGVAAAAGDATWNANFFGTSTWPTSGATGSFNATASGTAVVGGPIDTQQKWLSTAALVSDVQGWLDNPSTNFGWAIINANETSTQTFKAFYSRQATLNNGGTGSAIDPAWRPTLTVTFVPEPGSFALVLVAGLPVLSLRRRSQGEGAKARDGSLQVDCIDGRCCHMAVDMPAGGDDDRCCDGQHHLSKQFGQQRRRWGRQPCRHQRNGIATTWTNRVRHFAQCAGGVDHYWRPIDALFGQRTARQLSQCFFTTY